MEEEIGLEEILLTIEEFKEDTVIYNFYDGNYAQYVSEHYC